MSSHTVCKVARHMTSSSARRARRIWTSTGRPIPRHGLPLNEDVGPSHFGVGVATKFGPSSLIAQLLYEPWSCLRSSYSQTALYLLPLVPISYAFPVSISLWLIARCCLHP